MVPRGIIVLLVCLLASPTLEAPLDAEMGKALFERQWVAAPSSTYSDDGLGPIYDARSCAACHAGGGAGLLLPKPTVGEGIVIRLGGARGEPDPIYGFQLQTKALAGQLPEASPGLVWAGSADGLRVPIIERGTLNYGPLAPSTFSGLRRAPSLFGIGLLEQIPEKEILAQAQRERRVGLSGRAAKLKNGGLGRFGWKAVQPDLVSQAGSALSRDIGLSTSQFPDPWGECSAAEKSCRAGPHGAKRGAVEVPDILRNLIVAYLRALAAPQPRDAPRGRALFDEVGCNACHATLRTADGKSVAAYTDLLLHQMGPDLDDGIGEGAARSDEWRTAPLWEFADKLARGGLLHDGRARNVAEAIKWHGGDAAAARARFNALTPGDKAELVKFVEGL